MEKGREGGKEEEEGRDKKEHGRGWRKKEGRKGGKAE